jgi:hypothetical protein
MVVYSSIRFAVLRGFQLAKGPGRWGTAGVNPLPEAAPVTPAPVTPAPDGKLPQTTIDLSQPAYHLRASSKCRFVMNVDVSRCPSDALALRRFFSF